MKDKIFKISLLVVILIPITSVLLIGLLDYRFDLPGVLKFLVSEQMLSSLALMLFTLTCLFICCHFKLRNHKIFTLRIEKLNKENDDKSRLINILSHDIREPIKTFETVLNASEKGYINNAEFINHSKYIKKKLGPVQVMVDELLYWSLDQLGGLKSNPFLVNIDREVDQILSQLEQSYKDKNIRIIKKIECNKAYVDPNHFKIIMRNIIHNSIKYSHENSIIYINSQIDINSVSISVLDFGKGMSSCQIGKILNRDVSFDTLGTGGEVGKGVGLAFCMHLLKMNNGQVKISSSKGEGTNFQIYFPIESHNIG
ncbi:sensor histidine kinase [Marinigracilibium pacificum]|uniref:histidine kinase n=1 Tax=Marinigracilibium pacificum TaxID=2729599 RepID=A0A848IV18_9BACT|nr:HAMP domain-containing sensor histidine kinase [Marinigracilibium pacificum]NMM48343.1 HAMP domain-containing histidine kinase [Marinigracilibium pacificum]